MNSTKIIEAQYHETVRALENAIGQIEEDLSPGAKTKEKQSIRSQPQFQFARWKTKPTAPKEFEESRKWLVNLTFPRDLVEFFSWSRAFFNVGMDETDQNVDNFGSTPLSLRFPYAADLHAHNLEIFFEQRKPLEYRRLLHIGEFERHEIGLWLSPDEPEGMEVILFEQRSKRGHLTKDKFKVISSSFHSFLGRIAYCVNADIRMDLNSPTGKETEWLKRNEPEDVRHAAISGEYPYTFKRPLDFPDRWRVKDLQEELSRVLEPHRQRFGGVRDYDNEKKTLAAYRRRYKIAKEVN